MFSGSNALRLVTMLFASVMLMAAVSPSQAQTQNGTVRLKIVKAGFIIGAGGGEGTLTFKGKTYRLTVGGVGIGSLGVAAVNLTGTAKNLRSASDIVGTYGGAGAGGTFVGGGQVASLQNEKGVVLELRGAQAGFQVSLGLGGMSIAMK